MRESKSDNGGFQKSQQAAALNMARPCALWMIILFYFSYLVDVDETESSLWRGPSERVFTAFSGVSRVAQHTVFFP